jgi:ligand-binding sensor domain-containing protein/signal transduction histidine kinase
MRIRIQAYKVYCFIMLCAVLCCMQQAQAQRYAFYNLNVEKGLIQSQATSLAQDRFGHLWIGTLGGLSRYDGKNFTNYTVRDKMLNNNVSALAAAKDGSIWIGGPKGISQFDGKNFKHYAFESAENPTANSIMPIVIAKDNRVWCIAGGQLYNISGGKSNRISIPASSGKVTAILPDGDDVWAAHNGGVLYRYHNKTWDSLTIVDGDQANVIIYDIIKDSRQRILLATSAGLYTVSSKAVVPVKPRNYKLPQTTTLAEDKDGAIWLGTSNGAIKLRDSSLQFYNKKNGFTDNPIFSILADAEGNVWFATDGQGVFRYSGAQFTVLDESMGLPSAQVMSIAAAHGRLYLGTYEAGLFSYENGNVYAIPLPMGYKQAITGIAIRSGYDVWLGTRGSGILKYSGGASFKSYTYPKIQSNYITSFYQDGSKLWIGFTNGAMVYENDSFRKIPLKSSAVFDFIRIGEDSVLIAIDEGMQGIMLYSNNVIQPFTTGTAPDSAFAQCFAKKGNELWIGTSDNGVICYNLSTKKSYVVNKNNGLQSDFVYNIIDDDDGNIWVGTGYGIHKISTINGKPVVTFYGKEQGITGMESNHNAVLKMPDGSLWFGTTNGAVHYQPRSKTVSAKPNAIVLQSVKVFGESVSDTTYYDSTEVWYKIPYGLKLPYKKNNITLNFQAISLTGIEQIKYRYRLDGVEAPWSDWSNINTVTYSALPPGKYVFRVECISGNTDEVSEMRYPFEIITPFHKTGWFKVLIILGCILLGVTIQYISNRRKLNRLALMQRLRREEQNKVRERTAEDFHDEVGNKLTRINVLTDVLRNKIGLMSPETKRLLDQIQDNTGQLYGGTRDILWSLKPSNDNLYEILHRIRDFGNDLFQDTDIEFTFKGTSDTWQNYRLPMDISRNLIMIFKEALNNSLKYAKPKHVTLEAVLKERDVLQLILTDDGQGFNTADYKKGHGIDNMNVRAKRIHGKLYIDSRPGKGTIINLNFKLPKHYTVAFLKEMPKNI